MSATSLPNARSALSSTDNRSFALAALVVVLALVAGLGLKTFVEGRTTTVTLGGATSQVPQGWSVEAIGGELAFVASDPSLPGARYSLWILEDSSADLESAAVNFADATLASRSGLTIIASGPTRLGDADAFEIEYAFVQAEPSAALLRGIAWLMPSGDRLMAVVYEAPSTRFERDVERFKGHALSAGLATQ